MATLLSLPTSMVLATEAARANNGTLYEAIIHHCGSDMGTDPSYFLDPSETMGIAYTLYFINLFGPVVYKAFSLWRSDERQRKTKQEVQKIHGKKLLSFERITLVQI